LQIAALHQVVATGKENTAAESTVKAESRAEYADAFPTLAEALQASGACWTRLRIDWAMIQPQPPPAPYVWGPYHDEKLRLVADAGVQIIAHVDGVPEWAGDSSFGPIDPEHLDEFTQFLIDVVARYQQPPYNIHHWELFNEPDLTDPADPRGELGWGRHGEQYAQMLAVAYPAIKTADPEATVLMGGVAHDWFTEYGGLFYRYFPDDVMRSLPEHKGEYIDALNLHYFPDFHDEWERWDPKSEERRNDWLPAPTCGELFDGQEEAYEAGGIDLIAKVSHYRNRMRTCFGVQRPIWITELGEHGYPYDTSNPEHPDDPYWSLKQQARYVVQGHVRGLAAGAKTIIWFALISPPYDYHDQGLLYQEDWSPKPAYHAYQILTSELAGYTYHTTLDVPDAEVYVFRAPDGRAKTVAWADVQPNSDERIPVTFATRRGDIRVGPSRLRIINREGQVTYVQDGGVGDADGRRNGAVTLQLGIEPVFVSEWQ
jgi:hypothetical protein